MTSPVNPNARIAISSAMVPLHIATQCLTPRYAAIRRSNSCTTGPLLVSHWWSRIWPTLRRNASRLPMLGRPTCSGWSNAGGAPLMARSALLRMVFSGIEMRNWVPDASSVAQTSTGFVRQDPMHGIDHPFHILVRKFRRQRQAYGLPANLHGVGPLFRLPTEALMVIRMFRNGKIMHAGADPARVHGVEEGITADAAARFVHHDREQVPGVPRVRRRRRGQADRQVCE